MVALGAKLCAPRRDMGPRNTDVAGSKSQRANGACRFQTLWRLCVTRGAPPIRRWSREAPSRLTAPRIIPTAPAAELPTPRRRGMSQRDTVYLHVRERRRTSAKCRGRGAVFAAHLPMGVPSFGPSQSVSMELEVATSDGVAGARRMRYRPKWAAMGGNRIGLARAGNIQNFT